MSAVTICMAGTIHRFDTLGAANAFLAERKGRGERHDKEPPAGEAYSRRTPHVLAYMGEMEGDATAHELEAALDIPLNTINRILRYLVAEGLAVQVGKAAYGRRIYRITDAGREEIRT